MKTLGEDIQKLAMDAGGTWGIVLEDPQTDDIWTWNEEHLFTAASIIKVPIMVAVFSEFEERKFNLSDQLTLRREDIVGGSGILQHLSPGMKLTIYDLIVLMIIQSDNTATNMLIDFIGKQKIQQTMKMIGLEKSQFYNKLMTVPVERAGYNVVTAKEMGRLLKQIAMGKVISVYACEQMIDIMKKQQIQDSLAGKLPAKEHELIGGNSEWELAHKTGMISRVRHDLGIFYAGKSVLLATIFSKGIHDYESMLVFQDIGLHILDYLQAKQ